MTCDDVQHRRLEGRPAPGDDGHLAGCAACRELASAHQTALGLRALEPKARTRVRKAAVVTRAALVLAVVAGVLTASALRPRREEPVARPTVPPPQETALHDEEWAAFVAFTRGLEQDLSRDVVTADPLVPSHGALSAWVAPASTVSSLSREN
jgi:hypothetical protein